MHYPFEREKFSCRLRDSLSRHGLPTDSPALLAREFNRRFSGQAITSQAARKWLHGDAIPGQARLLVLAHWLGVSAEWLRYGEKQALPSLVAEPAPPVDLALMRDFFALSQVQQNAVRTLIRQLLREARD